MQQVEFPPLALVTGAAHRLGRMIALELAAQGYAIGLHYHHSYAAAQTTALEISAIGQAALLLPADLCDPIQIENMFAAVAARPYPLRVLVNSAARMERADLAQISPEDWDATLALNLRAPLLCAQHAAKMMAPGSLILNITDAGAGRAWSGYPAYAVSKAALETLTRLMARAFAPRLRVNAIAPGLILPGEDLPESEWQRLVARLPLQRAGSPEAIALAVRYLTQNDYVTGQSLAVDGGYQLT